jgi:hypothetical protein
VSDNAFDVLFYTDTAQTKKSISFAKYISLKTDTKYTEFIPIYETKKVTELIYDNITKSNIEIEKNVTTIKSYNSVEKTKTEYIASDSVALSDLIKYSNIGDCFEISVKGNLNINDAIDNVLKIGDIEFKQYAWWNASFNYRMHINCSSITAGTPISINGSGFVLNGQKQIVWTNCQNNTELFLYYNSNISYIVANNTNQLPHEVELGGAVSNNPQSVWDDNYLVVFHLNNLTGSQKNQAFNLSMPGTGALPTTLSCAFGTCYNFSGATNAILESNSNIPDLQGKNFTMELYEQATTIDDNDRVVYWGAGVSWGLAVTGTSWFMMANLGERNDGTMNTNFNHHITTTANGNVHLWNINGTVVKSWSEATGSNAAGALKIGGQVEAGLYFRGAIDEVRISNVTRSAKYATDVYKNYQGLASYGTLGAIESMSSTINITLTSQTPINLTIFNTITSRINITFNISDINISTFKLIYSTNSSANNIKDITGGNPSYNPTIKADCSNTTASEMLCQLNDNDILRGIYNYNQSFMQSTNLASVTLLASQSNRIRQQFVSNDFNYTWAFLELNCNGTGTNNIEVYYLNSTLSSVLLGTIPNNRAFDHRHSTTSAHHVLGIPYNITAQTIRGVKATNPFWIEIRGTNGADFICYGLNGISGLDKYKVSTNNGASYTSQVSTLDTHLHAFNANTSFIFYASGVGTDGNNYTSATTTDLLETFNLPPTPPILYMVGDMTQNSTQVISWIDAISPQLISISSYWLKLFNTTQGFKSNITNTTGSASSITYNATAAPGNYTIGIYAIDALNLTSGTSYSNIFTIPNYICSVFDDCALNNISACDIVIDTIANLAFSGNISSFDIPCACNTNFTCASYSACRPANVTTCLSVINGGCGGAFAGNLTDYDLNCTYVPPGSMSLAGYDLNSQGNIIIMFIVGFLWLGCMTLAFVFRNQGFFIFGFLLGMVLGFMFAAVAIWMSLVFWMMMIGMAVTYGAKMK